MIGFIFLISIATLIYGIIIYKIQEAWNENDFEKIDDLLGQSFVSVVVCVRNEAYNIENCVRSILQNDYPKELFEVIIVNDNSDDETLGILESIDSHQIRIVNLSDSDNGKKAGMNEGIKLAKGEIILCSDGDCMVPKSWISNLEKHITQNQLNFVTSIILPHGESGLVSSFQLFDFMLTMSITSFGIEKNHFYLANGANMGFLKSFYFSVRGFENNKHLASGDDLFLVQEASKIDSEKVGFLKSKSNIVYTKAEKSWKELWAQRLRWSSKMSAVKDLNLILLPAFVFIYHALILGLLVVSLINGNLILPISIIVVKMIIDYQLVNKLCRYFDIKMKMIDFSLCFFVYSYYIFLTSVHSIFPRPFTWKGRFVK